MDVREPEVYGICEGCGRPVREGDGRYTAFEPEQWWHFDCNPTVAKRAAEPPRNRRTAAMPFIRVLRDCDSDALRPGDRFAVVQPSQSSRAWRMTPRMYHLTFTVGEDGTLVQSYGGKPRPLYKAVAELVGRGGDLSAFQDGLRDGLDPSAPEPGGNQHPDYRAGFAVGRDPKAMAAERKVRLC